MSYSTTQWYNSFYTVLRFVAHMKIPDKHCIFCYKAIPINSPVFWIDTIGSWHAECAAPLHRKHARYVQWQKENQQWIPDNPKDGQQIYKLSPTYKPKKPPKRSNNED